MKVTKEIEVSEELIELIEDQKQLFVEYYGREVERDEFLFQFMPIYNDELLLKTVSMFREMGIEEKKIYAYYKTNGLIPCEQNLNLLSDEDLKEYEALCNEFDEKMNESIAGGEVNVIQYVLFSNSHIREQINYVIKAFIDCFNDFIRRHSETNSIQEYAMTTEIDYCMFSALKTVKVLHSLKELIKIQIPECIYALGRGVFENYMYLCAINKNPELFRERLLPKLDEENYRFELYPDGKVNYRKVICKETGATIKVEIPNKELKKSFPYKTDEELYDFFYQKACQYVHVDVMSAKSYFSVTDPYDEIDPSLVAALIILTITSLLLLQIAKNRNAQDRYRKDVIYLCEKLNCRLRTCLEIAKSDVEHPNILFDLLLRRLNDEDFKE